MPTNEGVIIATGGWPDPKKKPCPDHPKGRHSWQEIEATPGRKAIGERIVTSRCNRCGGIIKDCPTINA